MNWINPHILHPLLEPEQLLLIWLRMEKPIFGYYVNGDFVDERGHRINRNLVSHYLTIKPPEVVKPDF